MKNIKEEILHQLEKPISELTAQIIESEKAHHLKKTGKELNITPHFEKMIRLSLVIDLMKALQNYILPTDKLTGFNWYGGPKGIEISAGIEREGTKYFFVTEAITAGGYNIQRFHYRYIVKSKMPRVMSDLALNHIVPTAILYQNKLIVNANGLKGLGLDHSAAVDSIKEISKHLATLQSDVNGMTEARKQLNKEDDVTKRAKGYQSKVKEAYFDKIRYAVDKLELLVDDESWPLVKYRELLFIR